MAKPKPKPKTAKQVDDYKAATYDQIGLAPLFLGEIPAIILMPRRIQGFDLADALALIAKGAHHYSGLVRAEALKAVPPVEEKPQLGLEEEQGPEIVG
jgi:hypothetical protein